MCCQCDDDYVHARVASCCFFSLCHLRDNIFVCYLIFFLLLAAHFSLSSFEWTAGFWLNVKEEASGRAHRIEAYIL